MEVLLGSGIFNVDGELWRRQRKTASFEFASRNLRDFSTVVFREYSLKLSEILSQSSFSNKEVDMQVSCPISGASLSFPVCNLVEIITSNLACLTSSNSRKSSQLHIMTTF